MKSLYSTSLVNDKEYKGISLHFLLCKMKITTFSRRKKNLKLARFSASNVKLAQRTARETQQWVNGRRFRQWLIFDSCCIVIAEIVGLVHKRQPPSGWSTGIAEVRPTLDFVTRYKIHAVLSMLPPVWGEFNWSGQTSNASEVVSPEFITLSISGGNWLFFLPRYIIFLRNTYQG